MIAQVYPILKLPRRCGYFDYGVPEDIGVNIGDLVRVPFKNREVLGVVRGLTDQSTAEKLSRLHSQARSAYLTPADIARYEHIAHSLIQSVSSLLFACLPTIFGDDDFPRVQALGSVGMSSTQVAILEKCLAAMKASTRNVLAGDKDIGFALAHALRRKTEGQMLILLPRERELELLAQTVKLGDSVALLHGHTPPKDRTKIIEAWRTGKLKTLLGTRAASLLPAAKLDLALVLEAGNDEYANERRNPRFDAREAVKLLAAQHQATSLFFDSLPRLEEACTSELIVTEPTPEAEIVINLAGIDEIQTEQLLSQSLLEAIENALHSQKKVLLYLNRKGVAKRLQCQKCGHIPVCGVCGQVPVVRADDLICPSCQTEMWPPATCPLCGQAKLKLRGVGGAKIVESLRRLFPDASLGNLEKGKLEQPEADIVVATEYFFTSYLTPFPDKRYGLVADLAADIGLHAGDFRGAEETARKIHRLINFGKQQSAQVIIQTWLPEVITPMLDLKTFAQTELELRKRYRLPPFINRFLLSNATLDQLPTNLQELVVERDDMLEIATETPTTLIPELQHLPDSIKIFYAGTYAQDSQSPS